MALSILIGFWTSSGYCQSVITVQPLTMDTKPTVQIDRETGWLVVSGGNCQTLRVRSNIYHAILSRLVDKGNTAFLFSRDAGLVAKVSISGCVIRVSSAVKIPGAEQMLIDDNRPWLYVATNGIADFVLINAISLHATFLTTGLAVNSLAIDGNILLIAGNRGVGSFDLRQFDSIVTQHPDELGGPALQSQIKLFRKDGAYGPWSQEVFKSGDTVLVTSIESGGPLLPSLSPIQTTFKGVVGQNAPETQQITLTNPYPVDLDGLRMDGKALGHFTDNWLCTRIASSSTCHFKVVAPSPLPDTDQTGQLVIQIANQKLIAYFCQPQKEHKKCKPSTSGNSSQ